MLESDSNSSPIRPFQTLWSNNFSAPATLWGREHFKESILAVDELRLMVKMMRDHVAAQHAEDVLQAGYSPASGPSNPFVSLSQPSPSRRSLVWSSLAATWKLRILSSLGLMGNRWCSASSSALFSADTLTPTVTSHFPVYQTTSSVGHNHI